MTSAESHYIIMMLHQSSLDTSVYLNVLHGKALKPQKKKQSSATMERSDLSNFILVPAGEALLRTAEPAVHTGPGVQGDQPADGPHLCVCPHPRQVSPQSPLPTF